MIAVAVALVAVGGVLGFADARSPTGLPVPGLHHQAPGGYLYSDPATTFFVQWTQTGSHLAGTLEITYLPQNGATQITSETDSFTGVLASGNVTLTIDQSILGASNLSGTFDGSVLTLSIPRSDGTLQQVTLKPASLSDYDHDVAALKGVAQQNLLVQQQAQRQQAVAAARAEAVKQVDDAISAVQGDLQGLAQDSKFSDVLSQVAGALAQTNSELSTTQKGAQTDEAEAQQYPDGNYGQVCADASGVSSDASGVEASASGVELDLQSARGDIKTLQNDFAAIATAEGNIPTYHPVGAPTSAQVDSAVTSAQQAIGQALDTTNTDIDQANADVTAADQADQAGNCGSGPTAPQAQNHIS